MKTYVRKVYCTSTQRVKFWRNVTTDWKPVASYCGYQFLSFCHNSRDWQTDRRTDWQNCLSNRSIAIARQKLTDTSVSINFCRATAILLLLRQFCQSVCLSVCLSIAWIVTKRKKFMPTLLYRMKDRSVVWQEEWLVGDDPSHLQFWAKLTLFLRKRRFSINFRS